MSQNLSEYLSRRANGNVSSKGRPGDLNDDGDKKIHGSTASDDWNYKKNQTAGDWASLEAIIQNYEQHKTLPPLLSPILPDIYGGNVLKVDIPKMLSPTLPDIYTEKKEALKQPEPRRPNTLRVVDEDENGHEMANEPKHLKRRVSPNRETDIPKSTKNRSFEKVEHFGVHSYKIIETSNKKSLLLTLHVPKYHKNKRLKATKQQPQPQSQPLGLGIRRASEKIEKSVERSAPPSEQKLKKSSIFKGAVKESPASVSVASNGNNVNGSNKDTLNHGELMAKNEEYLKIAKDKKHKGDDMRNKNLKISIMCFMDSVIIYLVGFNYEDQSRRLLKKLYNDKNWLSLISLIDHVLRVCTDNEIVDIAGLCLQIKVVVYEHVCKILDEFIQLNNVKRRKAKTNEEILKIDENLSSHFKNYSKYKELSKKSLIQSERYLSVFNIQKKYPTIMEFYEKQPDRNRLFNDAVHIFNPSTDNIHLPISSGITLKEICAYSLKVVKQWCQDEHVKYNDWTF